VGSLDDRGFLSCDLDAVAAECGVDRVRVEDVLTVLQSLEPAGIASRSASECLLIQLRHFPEASRPRVVAEHLIAEQWDSLGRSSLANLAKDVDASEDEVREALCFIRENLNPFPAHAYWARERAGPPQEAAVCPEPDVIIREDPESPGGYQIELPKAGRYRLRVTPSARYARDAGSGEAGSAQAAEWQHWQALCGRARLFVRSVEQRWRTLHDLMRCLVHLQKDFLVRGERGLKPLTRAHVADIMDVHESTVSRAVAVLRQRRPRQMPDPRLGPPGEHGSE